MKTTILAIAGILLASVSYAEDSVQYWMKIKATDKYERSLVAATGVTIETVREDFVVALGNESEKKALDELGILEVSFPMTAEMDFPARDSAYHNYDEMTKKLQDLMAIHSNIASMQSIGKTYEGRDIWAVRISGQLAQADQLPAVVFMGGHHAREHLSIELPIFYVEYLLTEYAKGNPRIQSLVNSRDIHIIPMVNPDGAEYDIASGSYRSWRKNRARNSGNSFGVDLNRNYGFGWGGQGASSNPNSDTFRGPMAFSEPETKAIKKYVEDHQNITILLSFHTFSQLILYPFGHVYDDIPVVRDRQVHEVMAKKMATWNGYTPEKSSDLYLAAGDTTDWSYGEHKIISFTFELDPGDSGWGSGGFYPGAEIIPSVQQKNLEPVLYLIDYADNPYRALDAERGPIFKP
ncbi:M14 family metallopeptidase [Bdellovibrio sp. HCB2-146]|uniref:M14 family metallopeptidase n=1 Tax=Bdellovibrio sp. HCB2-146 TaxID=3394362 RepID=UPI0039BC8C02